MKKISIIMIILGIIIASYPFVDRAYTSYMQAQALSEWEGIVTQEEPEEAVSEDYLSLQEIFDEGIAAELGVDASVAEVETENSDDEEVVAVSSDNGDNRHMVGFLKIDKIDLKIPVLRGATDPNMKIGAGQIEGTTAVGSIGNAALAAHRSHTFGRFFNRLDELERGDTITVSTQEGDYVYTVYKKHVVEPTDLTVLRKNNRDRVLTLVTCHPLYTASHRLIVHAVIRE